MTKQLQRKYTNNHARKNSTCRMNDAGTKSYGSLLVSSLCLCIVFVSAIDDGLGQDLCSRLPQSTVFWCQTSDGKNLASKLLASSAGQSVGQEALNGRLRHVLAIVLSADAQNAIVKDQGSDFSAIDLMIAALNGPIELGVWKTNDGFECIAFVSIDWNELFGRAIHESLTAGIEPNKKSVDPEESNATFNNSLIQTQRTFFNRRLWIACEKQGLFVGSSREVVERFLKPNRTTSNDRSLQDLRSYQTIAKSTAFADRRSSSVRFFVDSRWLLGSGIGLFAFVNPRAPPSIGTGRDKLLQSIVKAGLFDTAGIGGVFEFSDAVATSEWTLDAQLILTEPRKGLFARSIFRPLEDIGGEIVPADVDIFYTIHCDLNELQSLEEESQKSVNSTGLSVQELMTLLPGPTKIFCMLPSSREFSTGRIQCFGRAFSEGIRGNNLVTAFEARDENGENLIISWMSQSTPDDWEQIHDSNGKHWVESAAKYDAKLKRHREVDSASAIDLPRRAFGHIGEYACTAVSDFEFLRTRDIWRKGTRSLRASSEFSAAYRLFQMASREKPPIVFWYYPRGQWLKMSYEFSRDNFEIHQAVREADKKSRRPENEANTQEPADLREQMAEVIVNGEDKLPKFTSLQNYYGALVGGVFDHETGFKLQVIQMRPLAGSNQDSSSTHSK